MIVFSIYLATSKVKCEFSWKTFPGDLEPVRGSEHTLWLQHVTEDWESGGSAQKHSWLMILVLSVFHSAPTFLEVELLYINEIRCSTPPQAAAGNWSHQS